MPDPSVRTALPSAPAHRPGRTIAMYASGRFYRQALDLVTALARPRLLTPEMFGVWTLLKVIPDYATHHHLGSRTMARYRIPLHDARGEREEAESIASAAFSQSTITVLALAAVLVVCGVAIDASPEWRWGLIAMAAFIVLQAVYEFYLTLLRATEHFALVTRLQYLRATTALILTIALLMLFGIYGLYLTVIATMAILLMSIRRRFTYLPRFRVDFGRMRALVVAGAPDFAIGFGIALATTVDRFVINGFLGAESLGHYGIAILVFGFLSQIPGATREVVEPRMMRRLADDPQAATERYFLQPMVNLAYTMPFLIAPVFFLLPLLVPLVLPRYGEGVPSAQILSLGAYCFGLVFLLRMMVVALSIQARAACLVPLVLLVNLGGGIAAVTLGFGVEGVAVSSVLSVLALFLLLLWLIARRLENKPASWARHMTGVLVAIPLTGGAVAGTYILLRAMLGSGWLPALGGLCGCIVLLIAIRAVVGRFLPLLSPMPPLRTAKGTDAPLE